MITRAQLLAGSVGPERVRARPHPDDADWYLPLHVRGEGGARARIAVQVAAGADVIVAPTWLTHRRALLPLGETRRAAAWTAAAVRVARDAVESGLEQRVDALAGAPQDDVRRGRPDPLVAASLPAVDDAPETVTGRLLPREAATVRDYRDQAGLLADADPDLLLVEGQRSAADTRMAASEAVDTGLPVWVTLSDEALATTELEAWLEWARAIGVARLLLLPPLGARQAAADSDLPWGTLESAPSAIAAWLEAGASAVALLDGATVPALEPLRAAIDEHESARLDVERAAQGRWIAHLEEATSIAPGGAAVWIGDPGDAALPRGFAWLVVPPDEVRRLPAGHYRLVVVTADLPLDPGRLLERGGILVTRSARSWPTDRSLRAFALDDGGTGPPIGIFRRED